MYNILLSLLLPYQKNISRLDKQKFDQSKKQWTSDLLLILSIMW